MYREGDIIWAHVLHVIVVIVVIANHGYTEYVKSTNDIRKRYDIESVIPLPILLAALFSCVMRTFSGVCDIHE